MSFALIFQQFCESTVYHGIRDIYESKHLIVRCLWAAIVIVASFFAVLQSLELMIGFTTDKQWQTTISSEAPRGWVPWPNGTICQKNPLDVDSLKKFNITDPYEIAFLLRRGSGVRFYDILQAPLPEYEDWDERELRSHFEDKYANCSGMALKLLTLRCENTMLDCGHHKGTRFKARCHCDRVSMPHHSSPNCFKVNFEKVIKPNDRFRTAGYASGLSILLDPRVNKFYPNLIFNMKPESGLVLRLYFGNDDVDGISNPIFLSPGTQTVVAMTAERRRIRLRPRYTFQVYETEPPCSQNIEYVWVDSVQTSRTLCQWDCYARFLMEYEHCRCIFPIASVDFKGDVTCSFSEDTTCWKNLINQEWWKVSLASGFNYTECMQNCKDACEYDRITTQVSSNGFPAAAQLPAYTRYLNRALALRPNHSGEVYTEDDVKAMITLELYYEQSDYLLIQTVDRVNMVEVVSQVGGTLGVWTGLSFIGILQIFSYLFRCLSILLKNQLPSRDATTAVEKSIYNIHF